MAEGSRDISGLSSGEVRVSGRASANQAQVQAVARGTSYRIREGVKAVIGQVLRMFRWALLPGNARETWGRDLVADLPAVLGDRGFRWVQGVKTPPYRVRGGKGMPSR